MKRKNKLTRDLKELITLIEHHGYFPVSYGLAPNVNGFSYENAYAGAKYDKPMNGKTEKRFNLLLDTLSSNEIESVKELYLK